MLRAHDEVPDVPDSEYDEDGDKYCDHVDSSTERNQDEAIERLEFDDEADIPDVPWAELMTGERLKHFEVERPMGT